MAASLGLSDVSAQTESASAEDGKPASEAPTETVTAPNMPLGANLTPPLGALPLGPAILSGPGVGQPGSSTVSMAPGTLTTGVAREGINAVRAPEAEPAPAPVAGAAPEAVTETAVTETSAPVAADTDGDGVADSDEVNLYGTDPFVWDTDGDGLSDGEELFVYGTDPLLWDTDGDGVSDGEEMAAGSDPLDPASVPVRADAAPGGSSLDSDADRLADVDEAAFGTDPNNPDSDGDGYYDGDEVNLGTDPLDSTSFPAG